MRLVGLTRSQFSPTRGARAWADRATSLFAPSRYRLPDVTLEPDGSRRLLVAATATEGGCPLCGVTAGRIEDRPVSPVKGLSHGPVGW